ncbi:cytochrome P450 2J4-like [Lytechinus pictus]|uniref:cytochrome P450 2J4-like n=1 Tax=Lytechinus pictus TaxID=7653 RepID=UPI0030B9FF26
MFMTVAPAIAFEQFTSQTVSSVLTDSVSFFWARYNIMDIISFSITFLLLGVFGFLSMFCFTNSNKKLPPGPWLLPFVRYRFGSGLVHETFVEVAKKYGPVFSVRRGLFLCVVLNDKESLKEALVKSGVFFSDRFVPGSLRWTIPDTIKKATVTWSNGKPWKDLRDFCLNVFRSFSIDEANLESRINLEARYMAEEIRNHDSRPMVISGLLNKVTGNIMAQLIFGHRFDYDDVEFTAALRIMAEAGAFIGEHDLVNVFERLIHAPRYKPFREMITKLKIFIQSQLSINRETFQKDHIRHFVDAFLADDISEEYKWKDFWRIAFDVFTGGTENAAVFASWAILLLAVHPDVQHKMQSELDAVVGDGRQPTTNDRSNLPYCEATLMEIMRIRPVLPLSLPHMTSADVTLGPYTVPKGTIVIPNLWAVHHDPKDWCDPHVFNPDRFLSEDGQSVLNNDALMPFSIGRRDCPGSQLGKMETFLLFTNLFQQFEFKLPPDQPTHNTRGLLGLTLQPEPYKICAVER